MVDEPGTQGAAAATTQLLDEAECLRLIAAGGVGRIGYTGRFGPTILPVNFALQDQTIVFRTGLDSPMGEDLRTGIADAEYKVAFEVERDQPGHEGRLEHSHPGIGPSRRLRDRTG